MCFSNSISDLTQEKIERNNSINKIIENLDFIREQNNSITSCLKGKNKATENSENSENPEKSESFDFTKELENLTKTIKNLDLDPARVKHESTPLIYKHWKPRK